MITAEPTLQLAVEFAQSMQRRQIEMSRLSIRFQQNILLNWIHVCKQLNIWPEISQQKGLLDIYA